MSATVMSLLNAGSLPWLDDAACADMDLDEFFVDAGKAIKSDAREVCRRCPVRAECVRHAYANASNGGYFGGLSPSQRRQMTLKEALAFIVTDTVGAPEHLAPTPVTLSPRS